MTPEAAKRSYPEIVEFMLGKLSDTGVITDLAPGGVARTLIEATAREFSEFYARMNAVYEAGFIDTATGASLDQLVAMLGLARIDGEFATADLRLIRDGRISARVIIPTGTRVAIVRADDTKVTYELADDYEMREGEANLVVSIRALPDTGENSELADLALTADDVSGAALSLVRPIAGIAGLELLAPSATLGTRESDEALRKRAKMAIAAAGGGTEKALVEELMALSYIKSVQLRDASDLDEHGDPVVPPGELEIILDAPEDEIVANRDQINSVIDDHKGPGILARVSTTQTRILSGNIILRPASQSLSGAEMLRLIGDAEALIASHVAGLEIGGTLVWNRILADLMNVENLADVVVADSGLSLSGGTAGLTDIQLGAFERMELGSGADALAVLPELATRISLRVTATPGMLPPGEEVTRNLTDVLVTELDALQAELNANPAAARSVSLTDIAARLQAAPAEASASAVQAALTAPALEIALLDLRERAEVVLRDPGTGSHDLPAGAILTLDADPLTFTWDEPGP